ncbi:MULTISPECIES: S41 family peptidase [Brevibacterium]|uniref:Tricorn protease homolog n=1 Tax=Brevibacterium antiquum CNRZ 918 TaxID=1255637 RepID=A0A2H1I847_9MICO|nr:MULTISPECIES: S41 family peptidase [Brevibacterium]SMX71310.1 tricorn protease [Brevibacterium antiquum CNRZ 918]
MTQYSYLRYPHIHGDLITFTADDDVWIVPSAGGRAWRLTSDHVPVRSPRISPDGTHIAYVSFRDGHPELMLAEVASGSLRRLSWLGGTTTTMLGWADERHILIGSNAGEFEVRNHIVKSVDLDGVVERLSLGRASGLDRHHSGVTALSTPFSRPPAHWKRYRGGTAPRLWLDRVADASGTGAQWQRLLREEEASLTDPIWVGDSLVFASDRAASFPDHAHEQANLWIWDGLATQTGSSGSDQAAAGEPRQLTFQTEAEGYVRDATTDGTRIVWHSHGEIRILDSLDAQIRTLNVVLPGTGVQPLHVDPTSSTLSIVPDHGGNASVVEWRGKTFWLTHREGPARALCADSSIRTREPVVLGQTGLAAYITDVEGEDSIEVRAVSADKPPRRIGAGALGRVLDMASDPAGKTLATISHDGSIRLVEVGNGRTRLVGHSGFGEARTPRFSPDGRYLVWSQPTQGEELLERLMLVDTKSDREGQALTSGKFNDFSPAFTADGKYLAFLSDRTFDPSYNQHSFDLSFNGVTRPWLLPLSSTEPAPFGPSASGWAISEVTDETSKADKAKAEKTVVTTEVDLAGAEERIVAFPVSSGVFHNLKAAEGGVLWMRTGDAEDGELGDKHSGDAGEKPGEMVQYFDFAKRKVSTVVDKADDYSVTGDGKLIIVTNDGDVAVRPATRKVEADDDDTVSVDLTRLRFELDQRAEWLQMFEENSRIMRDHYWRADMNGVNWEGVTLRWRRVAAKALTHDDLVDILWETVGELNTSHAYVLPSSPPGDQSKKLGFLGADLERTGQGWQIARILPGESSDPAARSPLRQAGVGACEGDLIVAVGGQSVDEVRGPAAHLVGTADSIVELTLRRGRKDRVVAIIPLANEEKLRYQDWVRSRREYVAEKSGGRVGYVHVPDMMAGGWAQLHRDLRQAMSAEGVIADVRFNRGGHTSALVAERFADRVIAWNASRSYDTMLPDPEDTRRGPVAFLANEFSGSDGDIINARVQAKGLGPVIGVRTWGGVVGIDGRYDLVDGTGVTQPRYAFWLEGKGWDVENYGVEPDIEVEHDPSQLFSDDDLQLDRAIAEVLAGLEDAPAATPPDFPAPRVQSSPQVQAPGAPTD